MGRPGLRRTWLRVGVLALAALGGDCASRPPPATVDVLRFRDSRQLERCFSARGYTREALRESASEVPRLFITRFPQDWAAGTTPTSRKSLFFRALLPLVLKANERILEDRGRLQALLAGAGRGEALTRDEGHWLRSLGVRYRVWTREQLPAGLLPGRERDELLLRIDAVPVSVALGQAAYESGYASARGAHRGNALFGQWHWGRGLRPRVQRPGLGDYRLAAFGTALASVEAYAWNLNTHGAYAAFRHRRADQRRRGGALDGLSLAETLSSYSESGEAYVRTLRGMIRHNRLQRFDSGSLSAGRPLRLVPAVG